MGWITFGVTIAVLLAVSTLLVLAVVVWRVWTAETTAAVLAGLALLAGIVELAAKADGLGTVARDWVTLFASTAKVFLLAGAVVAVVAPTFVH
jgi:hypothetical protein